MPPYPFLFHHIVHLCCILHLLYISMATFFDLPYELRARIWLESSGPRAVGIIPYQDDKGDWTIKSTLRPPTGMHVHSESRHMLSKHYKYLKVAASEDPNAPGAAKLFALEAEPWILFDFDVDTLHFVHRSPTKEPVVDSVAAGVRAAAGASVMNLLLLKELVSVIGALPSFGGPGARDLVRDWPYLLGAKDVNSENTSTEIAQRLESTHVRHLRFDFDMFLSTAAVRFWQFTNWMPQAAKYIESPQNQLMSCDLIMGTDREDKATQRTLRLALRPEKESDPEYQALPAVERLAKYGAVVFKGALPTPESKAIVFEVVDPRIGAEAISTWEAFSVQKNTPRVAMPNTMPNMPTDLGFRRYIGSFWGMYRDTKGLEDGEESFVHGLCLADYRINGGFRG